MNGVVETVIEFLTRSYSIQYEENFPVTLGYALGGLLLAGGAVMLPLSGIFYAASGLATLFSSGCAATGGGVASAVAADYLAKKKSCFPNTLQCWNMQAKRQLISMVLRH